VSAYLIRAYRALATAQADFERGDTIAPSNRLSYPLFDAMRAVLEARGLAVGAIRTHTGIMHVFRTEVVLPGLMDEAIARVLPRAFELRTFADYSSHTDIDAEIVRVCLDEADAFVRLASRLVEACQP
jgi:uncharacterized protein (UPF0332 family)